MSAGKSTQTNSQFERLNYLHREFGLEDWSTAFTSDPRCVKCILGLLMLKTVVPHLVLDCSNDCRDNSDYFFELLNYFFPAHFFMEKKPFIFVLPYGLT